MTTSDLVVALSSRRAEVCGHWRALLRETQAIHPSPDPDDLRFSVEWAFDAMLTRLGTGAIGTVTQRSPAPKRTTFLDGAAIPAVEPNTLPPFLAAGHRAVRESTLAICARLAVDARAMARAVEDVSLAFERVHAEEAMLCR